MNPHELDDLLARESARAMPPAPDLRAAVRREIERRSSRSRWDWIFPWVHWGELVSAPRVAFAAMAFAAVAGVVPTVALTDGDEVSRARDSLHLEVFSVEHGSVPMTMLPRAS